MKTYSKRKSIITLIVFALALAGILLMVLLGIGFEHVGRWDQFGKGLDLEGGVSITYQAKEGASQQDMDDTIMKLQERVEEFSTEAQVYQEGTNRITVEIPGQNDPAVVLAELGNPGTLIFCTDAAKPQESTALTGNDITDAYAATNPEKTSEYVVVLTLTTEGQAKFAEVTGKIAGTGNPLYIMFDGEIISQPVARQKITSPTCQVEGITDLQEATRLASYIRIGALPTELQEISSRVVGATLGANAVNASITAMAIGLAIICILMIIVFRMPGFAASVALVSYTGLVFLILSIFRESITLTLPGIAGIILGIGMAVDANVIIFSRIREEIGLGAGTATAVHTGFQKALSAIIDGNVTTLLAAI
ncbi:MAG: SecD/SecF family protein translocase subunit, partial [Lachnospiraceae bacterium]|nr:SecD/SecF family protein translocase subunit [Lachnospiraceae bacterium]